jgi:hypothetical protein
MFHRVIEHVSSELLTLVPLCYGTVGRAVPSQALQKTAVVSWHLRR